MSRQPDQLAQANPAELYHSYFVPAIFGPWAEKLVARVEPKPGERALDIACGTGAVARLVAERIGRGGSVVGLDVSPGMLAVARSLPAPIGAPIEWVEGSAGSLPLDARQFDLVVCQQGLQFFPEKQAAVNEMRRVLLPGSRVGLSVWRSVEHQSLFQLFDEAIERHLGKLPEAVGPCSFGDAGAIEALLVNAGFRDIAVESVAGPVRFAQPEMFTELTIAASAAVMPEYEAMDDATKATLIEAIKRDLQAPLQQYTEGDEIVFTMTSHIVVAHA